MKLLLVEDEQRLAAVLRHGLTTEGHVVDVVGDGHAGLRAASRHAYDVIILDIMLPGLSGYRVLERLRQAQVWTPVLILTAKDGEYDEADAFDLGGDDYLTKPFSFVVLLARLRSLARRAGRDHRPVLQVGDLRMEVGRHRVYRGDVEISLTAREFGLLEHLMRNAGDVLTKSDLLSAVWDLHYHGDVNVVELYIGYLRRKIDRPFERASIQTIRGVGYRLAEDQPG